MCSVYIKYVSFVFTFSCSELNLDGSDFPGVKMKSKVSLRSFGSREGSLSGHSGECSPVPVGSFSRRGFVNGSRESPGYMEELEKERYIAIVKQAI